MEYTRTKKRRPGLILLAVILILIIAAGGLILADYFRTDETAAAVPEAEFAGEPLSVSELSWYTPVAGGLLTKPYTQAYDSFKLLGTFEVAELPLEIPSGLEGMLSLTLEDEIIFAGTAAEYDSFVFTKSGQYTGVLTLVVPESKKEPWGQFTYDFGFTIDGDPEVVFAADSALQGDLVTVRVDMGIQTEGPVIETELGTPSFVKLGEDLYEAYIPINYNCEPGAWAVTVSVGDHSFVQEIQVNEREYSTQRLTMSAATIAATTGAPGANEDWNEKMVPLLTTADPEKYWEGEFMQPCQGRISSKFGLYRYTNDNPVVRHTGIDIACPQGTPIAAPNNGRVVFADFVIKTGYTVVIEHGGGLKTHYYHMVENLVQEGDFVEKGDIIALVGTTGYSTGPHLHFEVKLGEASLSPWELFDGTSSLFME